METLRYLQRIPWDGCVLSQNQEKTPTLFVDHALSVERFAFYALGYRYKINYIQSYGNEDAYFPHFQLPLDSEGTKEALASIKAAFGFTTKDLAEVLHVERQTIYAWIRGENYPNNTNNRRIRLLMTLADDWNAMSKLSAKKVLRIKCGEDDMTFYEALCQDSLDDEKIRSIVQQMARLNNETTERNRKTRRCATSVQFSEYDIITHSAFIPQESK